MKIKKRLSRLAAITSFALLLCTNLFAQQAVTGFVRATTGEPLTATISIKGSTESTATDTLGNFSINAAAGQTLLVTSVGYQTKEVKLTAANIAGRLIIDIEQADNALSEVIVTGYGTQKKGSLTGSIATVTAKDLDRVHAGSTVSSGLAGKIPGVSFRMPDGRPGASANIQIRNMGNVLYVIDGIQQDAGQFNNIAPTDIESITVLKDASAAIYGVRAANGVVVVTTKRGKMGPARVNVDYFYGMQNWVRFPKVTTSSYDYMRYKAEAELNGLGQSTGITDAELDRYKAGTELGYQSFDWRDFILKPNAPLSSLSANITGGNESVKYYVSATKLAQNSPLGREFKFDRTNFQSNIDAKVTKRLKLGVQVNGRQEVRTNPGVPGGDDYWLPRFAILRNLPFERPYANDNPEYLNTIQQNDANWGFINYKNAGKFKQEWRVLQLNGDAEWQVPGIKGLTLRGVYSYYIADLLYNNQEYTYKTYTYRPATDIYEQTGGSINPWREKEQIKQINVTTQAQLNYNASFGEHSIAATFVAERISNQRRRNWVRSIPPSNALALIYFPTLADYNDQESRDARVGYIGRINYNFASKYYLEVSGRRDGSSIFPPNKRSALFPMASVGWRITNEKFMKDLFGGHLTDLKLRASYGKLGDDNINEGYASDNTDYYLNPFFYLEGYRYGANGLAIIGGQPLVVSRDAGVPQLNISWFNSNITDVGADFTLFNGKITGAWDYFYRKRTGLRARKLDVLIPEEIGYNLPTENINSDAQYGHEGSITYHGKSGEFNFNIGANYLYSRSKFLSSYNPTFQNSLDKYRNSREDRFTRIDWGYEVDGQFQSQEEINNYPVNIDGQGNRTLLPGDLKYKDVNNDGKINNLDERPIGYGGPLPNINFGLSLGATWKALDFNIDFSGGAGYTWFQNYETRWAFQNGGNLNTIFEDRWHREDMRDLNSAWIPGKYPANRFNQGGHSDYNKTSTFWAHNVKYLRARTVQLGYTVPSRIMERVRINKARIFINAANLFSIDNLQQYNIDPEIQDDNGLQFPQMRNINFGFNLTF